LLRVLAALVLAPLAIAVAYIGGWLWAAFVFLAAIGLYVEWLTIVGARATGSVLAGIFILLGAGWIEAERVSAVYAFAFISLCIGGLALLCPGRRFWAVLGILYALAAFLASIALRLDAVWGFSALIFVLLVVWVTDIGGYFAGRWVGGPKLWVRISPKKTWAGAIGGFAASLCIAGAFAALNLGKSAPLLLLGAILSIVSQLGDLFESAIKRRFGVKDSSHIIPGHGGLMDRLDGFVAAAVVAAIFGIWRGGVDGVGRGLMVW